MQNNIEIKIVDKWIDDEIMSLYRAGGWWKDQYNPSSLKDLIKGSYKFAVVIDRSKGKAIGMGRILSDGISDAYIQDLIILPAYRNQGLGKKLVNFLLNICLTNGINWIGLIAEPNQDEFYSKIGFKTMNNYVPMKYKIEE